MESSCSLFLRAIANWACSIGLEAQAFQYKDCDAPLKWSGSFFQITQNVCSIPHGSKQDSALQNAISQSNKAVIVVSYAGDDPPDKCEWTSGDGYHQVALVSRSSIDGKNGVTKQRWRCGPFID